MSSLTIEMGLARRRPEAPVMPDRLANRNDMTLAQKQRLAVLAKMGVGPVAEPSAAGVAQHGASSSDNRYSSPAPAPRDRKAELLERERRMRDEEDRQREVDEVNDRERRSKRARPLSGGMSRLGPVMPRDEVPQVLPTPAQVPEPKQWANQRLELKISKDTAERAKGGSIAERPEASAPTDAEDEDDDDEEDGEVPATGSAQPADKLKRKQQQIQQDEYQRQQKGAKKKKRNKRGKDEDAGEWRGGEGDSDEDEDAEDTWAREHERKQARDGGISKQMMIVEPIKGKVSTANKNFTDADLERRFSMPDPDASGGSLMTEEQVLRIIRREKQERGAPTGSASKRVQRELDDWAEKKKQQRARVKSPHRFERMVIARK
eukprot:TRINITY_DN29111_c0_g1_i1.p1 TRINITY_DN29111_c0_g1~~TRINITY_DN29111_c0_g1_i1.p1  ORF type:complete len:377 (+),score=104.71 TRINITY_DN29111_c0_g1_i1:163-1293(+)